MLQCFCLQKYTSLGKTVIDFTFTDGGHYCSQWYKIYITKNNYIYYTSMAITVLNTLIKFVIRKISIYQRMHTKSEILKDTTMKMFVFQIANTVSSYVVSTI